MVKAGGHTNACTPLLLTVCGSDDILPHAVLCVQLGWTALHLANLHRHTEMFKLLRSKGAKEVL